MMAISRPSFFAVARTRSARSTWSLVLPWEKLRRTTSTPAASIRARTSGSLQAGPRVATILVARGMAGRKVARAWRDYRDVFAAQDAKDGKRFARTPLQCALAASRAGPRVRVAWEGAMRNRQGIGEWVCVALFALAALSCAAEAYDGPVEKKAFSMPSYSTVGGKPIINVRIGYETYGKLNAAGDNAIFIPHYFSGTSHAAGKYQPS